MPPSRFRSRRLTFEQADHQCRTTLGRPALHFFWPLLACYLPPRSSRRPCTIGGSILKGSKILWPQPDTRTIVEPQPSAFRLFGRYFKPLTPPDTLHPFAINLPAIDAQERGNPAIAIAAVGSGQLDNRRRQRRFIVPR